MNQFDEYEILFVYKFKQEARRQGQVSYTQVRLILSKPPETEKVKAKLDKMRIDGDQSTNYLYSTRASDSLSRFLCA